MAKRTLCDLGISRSATTSGEDYSRGGVSVDGGAGTSTFDTSGGDENDDNHIEDPSSTPSTCDSECCKYGRVKLNQPESHRVLRELLTEIRLVRFYAVQAN